MRAVDGANGLGFGRDYCLSGEEEAIHTKPILITTYERQQVQHSKIALEVGTIQADPAICVRIASAVKRVDIS